MTTKQLPHLEHEKTLWQRGSTVIGVDEVGRGALAGPIVVAAVSFSPQHHQIEGVNDSKKVSLKKRLLLAEQVTNQAEYCQTGQASVAEINKYGIVPATMIAISRAISQQQAAVLMDGKPFLDTHQLLLQKLNLNWPQDISYIIKGDSISYSIAAASIVAKVYRDKLMAKLGKNFEPYGWQQNVGYGTKQHREALQKVGATEHHRTMFIRGI